MSSASSLRKGLKPMVARYATCRWQARRGSPCCCATGAYGGQVIQQGDELLVITEAQDVAAMRALFTMPAEEFAERWAAHANDTTEADASETSAGDLEEPDGGA